MFRMIIITAIQHGNQTFFECTNLKFLTCRSRHFSKFWIRYRFTLSVCQLWQINDNIVNWPLIWWWLQISAISHLCRWFMGFLVVKHIFHNLISLGKIGKCFTLDVIIFEVFEHFCQYNYSQSLNNFFFWPVPVKYC